MAIHRDALAYNGWIERKAPLPVVVTDDGDRMGVRDFVVILGDRPAEKSVDAERRKKAAGDILRVCDFSLPVHRHIDALPETINNAYPGRYLAPLAQLFEESIGEATPFFEVFPDAFPF